MPTCLEHWLTMAPTTCYGYKRRYHDVETLKKQIIIHGKNAGVIIADNNDGPVLSLDDFIKVSPKILSRKRPRIEEHNVPVVKSVPINVVNDTEQPMEQPMTEQPMTEQPMAQPLVHTAEQPMEQAQTLVHTAEQPIAQAQTLVQEAEQPIAQAVVPMQEANAVPVQAPIAFSTAHLPNANGARKPLVLNGVTIEVDPMTFMVNATQMCRAAGKLYAHYSSTIEMTEFVKTLSSTIGIPIFDLVRSIPGHYGGTVVHRRVAMYLAQRISPVFNVQVTGYLDELLLAGRVELGKEMNVQQLEQVQTLVQEAEQPSAQAVVPMQEANAVPVQAPIASSTAHLPNDNGARRVVPTNTLVLNGIVIEVDPVTFMVNATQMCRAAGKLFGHYWQRDSTKNYLQELSSDIGIPISEIYKKNQGGRGTSQDTSVHFRLALHLAYWLSTEVQVQFSKWIGELLLTGRVELGKEMNVQQLEDVWRRKVQEKEDKASADLSAEQDRSRDLEMQLATIQDAQGVAQQHKMELMAIKVREDLEAAIQFQVNTTAPRIATYKEGDNVLYLARIEETKFKYGHTKNLKQRLEAHRRPGVYPTLELVWIVKSNNGVASEDQLHAYVKKKKIIAEYGTQREVIVLKSVDDLERMLKKMNKCALPRADADIDMKRMEEETKRMEITEKTKQMEINAKTKQMEINPKTMLMQMLANKTITFEQYLQIKD